MEVEALGRAFSGRSLGGGGSQAGPPEKQGGRRSREWLWASSWELSMHPKRQCDSVTEKQRCSG